MTAGPQEGPGFEGFLLDRVDVAVVVNDDQGRVTHWNRYAEDLFGWPKRDAIGRDVRELIVDPGGRAQTEAIFTRVRRGETWDGDVDVIRMDGSGLTVHATYSPIYGNGQAPDGMVAVCVDITQRREAEDRLTTQYEISKTLADASGLEAAVPHLLETMCRGLQWQVGALWAVDEGDELLRCIDVWHVPEIDPKGFVDFTRRMTFQPGLGLPGRVWKEGVPAWIRDAQRDPNFPRAAVAAQGGLHAGFAFPIVLHAQVLGVVEFFSEEIRPPDEGLLRMVSAIGAQIGQFMRRTEATAAMQRANRRLNQIQTILETALAHLSLEDLLPELLKRVQDVLHTDIGTILLVNEEDANLRVRSWIGVEDQRARDALIPIGEGIAGLVALRREPMIVDLGEGSTDTPEIYRGMRSLLAVPLLIEGRAIGVLVFGAREGRPFSEEDSRLLAFAADRIAIAIENASLYEREHRVAMMLQRALLPDRLPGRPGLDLAARYVPGGAGVMVGGDWYDVVLLDEGRLGIAIGDVVGRGARAASIMGQLRHSLRAFALDGAHPAELLSKLNSALTDDVTSDMATIVYLELNEENGELRYAIAGHPPPIVRRASGEVVFLDGTSGIPVGTWPDATYDEGTARLEPGDTLLLYTDGLVEEREIPIDEGLAKLSEAAGEAPPSMDEYCDILLKHMFDDEPDDDIAILAVHRSTEQRATFAHSFPSHASAIKDVRERVRRWLESLDVHPHDIYDVTLAATEAVANAIEHPRDSETHDFQINGVVHDDRLELNVRDHGRWREPAPSDRGRGLQLMRGLMDQVEVERLAHGTQLRLRKRVRLHV